MESVGSKDDISHRSALNKNSLYKTVFDKTTDGVILLDAEGKVVEANSTALSVFEIDNDEPQLIFAKAFFSFHKIYDIHSDELPKEQWPIVRLLRNESFENEKLIVVRGKDQSPMHLAFTGIPQTNEKGKVESAILFIRDITNDADMSHRLDETEMGRRDEYFDTLEHYQKSLKGERQLLQSIIDTIPVMVTIYQDDAASIVLNNEFVKITGWTNEDASENNIMDLVYPNPAYRENVRTFMKRMKPGFKDIVMRTKDGRDIETSWANVRIPDGRQVGVGIDITNRKRLENELVKARKKAEKENQVQYAFIQNISHEVRTPMNSILGYTELLRKRNHDEKENEFIEAISYNGQQLLRLIDDIMDFSRLDKNELTLEKEEVHLKNVIKQTRKQFKGMKSAFKKNHHRLQVKSAHNPDKLILFTDSHRLQQILTNLVSNAVKYTEKGWIEFGFEVRKKENDIVFYVKDTGIGIQKEDHQLVFNRFHRFHNTAKTEFRGTGLGLAICKHLVELLGGEIWFESEPGKGSTFYFSHPVETLPLHAELVSSKERFENINLPDLTGRTILIAEDDKFSYMLMYHMLNDTNAKILHADTGSKAVQTFQKNNIDLVFLDIRLPEMDGFSVIKEIRKSGKNIPVIAQTANVLPEDKKKIRSHGFDYHACKPIEQNELYGILNRFLNRK